MLTKLLKAISHRSFIFFIKKDSITQWNGKYMKIAVWQ